MADAANMHKRYHILPLLYPLFLPFFHHTHSTITNQSKGCFLLRWEKGCTNFSIWHSRQQPLIAQSWWREDISYAFLYNKELKDFEYIVSACM